MGEFMEYQGERIKIGTCEDLYYLREDQRELVRPCGDADVNNNLGAYRFRFPFPDEDGTEPGQFGDPFRSVEIPGYMPEDDYPLRDGPPTGPIRLVQQAHREGELRIVVRDSAGEHDFECQLFNLTKLEACRAVHCLLDYSREHEAPQYHDGGFYFECAKRVLAGYGYDQPTIAKLVGEES